MVSMTTRTSRRSGSSAIRRVASRPSMPGMRMSIRTTSGTVLAREPHRLVAVGRLADHLDVVLGVEQRAEAGAHERLVVGEQDADHRDRQPRAPTRNAAARAAARPRASRRAAAARSRMPGEAVAVAGCRCSPRPSSATSHDQLVAGVGRASRCALAGPAWRMHVRDRLLADAVRGAARRSRAAAAACPRRRSRCRRPAACASAARSSTRASVGAGALVGGRRPAGAATSSTPRTSRQRLAAGALDRLQRRARLLGVAVQQVQRGARPAR